METRQKFEALPEIKRKMGLLIKYDPGTEMYAYIGVSIDEFYLSKLSFIGGAWYAFQEQDKKIDESNKMNQKMMNRVIELSAELEKLENRIRRME